MLQNFGNNSKLSVRKRNSLAVFKSKIKTWTTEGRPAT